MPLRINSSKGYIRQSVSKYMKIIINDLLPALEKSIEKLSINTNPIRYINTIAEFSGTLNDRRIILEFSSNDSRLDDASDSSVFCSIYYKESKEDAGIIDLVDIQSCVEMIVGALYDLGYKSSEDLAKEKADQEAKEKEEYEKKMAEEKKRKEQLYNEPSNDSSEEEQISPEEESIQSINDFSIMFDKYLKALINLAQIGSSMIVIIAVGDDKTKIKLLNITLTYISSNTCLIETEGINPKVNKTVTWDKAKNYCINVAKKVNGVISIDVMDEEGKAVDIYDDEENQDIDVNVEV